MSEHIEKPRIVGEFYVAEHHSYDTPENEWYLIHRIGDERMRTVLQVTPRKDHFGDPYGLEERTKHQLERLDEQARHWIEHIQAQNQELREAAARLVGSASRHASHTAEVETYFTISESDMRVLIDALTREGNNG